MKNIKFKKPLIVTSVFAALFIALIVAINSVAFFYGTALELFFGTFGGQHTVSDSYKSDYDNVVSLRGAQEAFARTVTDEGAVLLKNENTALPLPKGARVTVLGSETWYNSGTGSGAVANKEYSHITPTYALEQAGFMVNPDNAGVSDYTDAAIFIISRTGGEGQDVTLSDPKSPRYLQLTDTEREELSRLKNNGFNKVVVILNTCNALNMEFVDRAEYGIDACMWLGTTGCNGLEALVTLLNGDTNPSGHLTDTYLYDNMTNPVMQNFGDTGYEGTKIKYVNYVEGIYLGYKYFETRYEDVIMGTANAGNYDYDSVVYRPFGFGLSYTDFEWSGYTITTNGDGTVTVSVTVTNTGGTAGKDVVEVYFQSPYTDYDKEHLVEKAAVNLAGFAKTGIIEPGSSETVTVTFNAQDTMKSYDAKGAHTYIMDEGDYYITAAKNAHAAANNFLAAKGFAVPGNADMTGVYNVAGFLTLDTDSVTGVSVTNRFDDAVALDTEYLSRHNWSRIEEGIAYTYPGTNIENLSANYYNNGWAASGRPPSENNTSEFFTKAAGELTIGDMVGLDYNDPKWNDLLDQLSLDEMHALFKRAGYTTAAMPSIGKEQTYDFDGPAGIVNFVSGWASFGYPTEALLACTWNVVLSEEMGRLVGEDGIRADIQGWYAPSMNIHRSALSGRNFEYYSEDGILSGLMGAAETRGAISKGMYVYIKHLAVNDQETNRQRICTWLTEQALREIYLKPFEISVKDGGATGVMGSMNYIGYRPTVGSYALLTEVLRNEWGFHGGVVTDFSLGDTPATADQMLAAGTNLILLTSDLPLSRTNSWTRRNALRESAHEVLYMTANSIAVDAGTTGTPIYYIFIGSIDLLALLAIVFAERAAYRRAVCGAPDYTPEQRKKRRIITLSAVIAAVIVIAGIAIYFVQVYMSRQF
jgi:beta-glucosidase